MDTKNETVGLCQCGCGQKTNLAPWNALKRGWIKGEPVRFISGHNGRKNNDHELWAKQKCRHSKGYILVRAKDHPKANNGAVLEHILVAEQMLGRYLLPGECVHHKNENKTDNRPENLKVFPSSSAHYKFHQDMIAIRACGNPSWRKCQFCKSYDDPSVMVFNSPRSMCHRECRIIYWRKLKSIKEN